MTNFVNIAPQGKTPAILDIDAITMIADEKDGMGLFSRDGLFYQAGNGPDAVTAQDVIGRLQAAGVELVKFPVRWPDSKTDEDTLRHTYYIRPEAFSYYISSAQSSDVKGLDGPHCAAMLRVDGSYRLESTAISAAEEAVLLDAVRRHNANLVEVGAKEAHSRFYNPGVTVFNPEKVTAIRPDPVQVNVFFSPKDRIDFKLPEIDKNALLDQLHDENPGLDYKHLLPLFYKEEEAQKTRPKEDFARAIAAKTPQLQEFKNSNPPAFMSFDSLTTLYPHDDGKAFTAYYNKMAGDQYAESANVYFTKPEDMQAALADFTAYRNKGPAH